MLELPQFQGFENKRKIYINSVSDLNRFFKIEKIQHSGFNIAISCAYNDGKFRRNTTDIIRNLVNRHKDIIVHFIGITHGKSDYAKMIRSEFGDNRQVHFLGYTDTAELFKSMDMVINLLPNNSYATSECFMQEAMASGLPHIRLGGKGCEDIVTNGIDGYYTYEDDEFYKYFEILYKDEIARKLMGGEAKSTVEASCMPEYSMEELRKFYKRIIAWKK
jgi:glycosyltransferase involved in cell wall biosynthesis